MKYISKEGEEITSFEDASEELKENFYSLSFEEKIKELNKLKESLPDDFPDEAREHMEFSLFHFRVADSVEKSGAMKLLEKFNSIIGTILYWIFILGVIYFVYIVGKYIIVEDAQFDYKVPALMIVGSIAAFILNILFSLFIGYSLRKLTYLFALRAWKQNSQK